VRVSLKAGSGGDPTQSSTLSEKAPCAGLAGSGTHRDADGRDKTGDDGFSLADGVAGMR
jgi:hypothetical protein